MAGEQLEQRGHQRHTGEPGGAEYQELAAEPQARQRVGGEHADQHRDGGGRQPDDEAVDQWLTEVVAPMLRPPEQLCPHVVPVFGAAVFVASPIAYAVAGVLFEHLAVGTVLVAVAVGASLCALLNLARRPADGHRDRTPPCGVRP